MALLPSEEYVESGYLADDDYVGGIADAVISLEPYVVEDYIETGYFQEPGSVFSIVINTDGVVQEASGILSVVATSSITGGKLHSGEATITDAFNTTMSATARLAGDATMETYSSIEIVANRTRSGESSLEWFANLDAQADRFRSGGADFSSYFWVSDSSHNFGTGVDSDATYDGASDLVSAFGVAAEGLNVQFGDALLSSAFESTASGIEYISRYTNSDRPYTMQVFDNTNTQVSSPSGSTWQYSSSIKKYNSYSVNLVGVDYYMQLDKTINFSSDDFVVEWWQYTSGGFSSGDYLFRMVYTDGLGQGEIIDLRYYDISGVKYLRMNAREDDDSGSSINDATLGANLTGWHHYAIVKNSSGISLILDGTSVVTRSFSSAGITANSATPRWYAENKTPYFDGIHIQRGSDSFNAYSSAPAETESTLGIWDFETTLSGGSGGALTFDGDADLTSSVSVVATISGIQSASATLASEGFVVSAVGRISDFFVNADVISSVTADALKTVGFTADIGSVADFAVTEDLFKDFAADLPAEFGISNLVGATRQGAFSGTMVLNVDVAPGYVAESSTEMSATATVSVTGGTIKSAFSSMNAAFGQTTNAGFVADGAADLETVALQTSSETRIRFAETDFASVASTTSAVNFTGDGLLSAGWVADLSATGVALPAGSASILSEFGFSVITTATVPSSADLTSTLSMSVEPSKTTRYSAALVSEFDTSVITTATVPSSANISSEFGIAVSEDYIRPDSANISSEFGISVSPSRTRSFSATPAAQTSVLALGSGIYSASIDLTGFYTLLNVAKVLHIEQFVYVVPRETRTYTIPQENRSHTVTAENRSYTIEG